MITTDVAAIKELSVVVRFYDKESMKVRCNLYELVELSHGNAEIMFKTLTDLFQNSF